MTLPHASPARTGNSPSSANPLLHLDHRADERRAFDGNEHRAVAQPLRDPHPDVRRDRPHRSAELRQHGDRLVVAVQVGEAGEAGQIDERKRSRDTHCDSLARDDGRMGLELPPFPSGELAEREMLEGYLDWYRVVIVRKVEGLPRELAIRPMPPGILSALGIVKHLGWVERGWSRRSVLREEYPVPWNDADPDADLRIDDDETVDSVIAFYRTECEAADAIWRARALDETGDDGGKRVSIRWILNHMIEETARHAGHLDLIAESLDGRTGD